MTKENNFFDVRNISFQKNKVVLGCFLMLLSIALFISFISFYFNWKVDQSQLNDFFNREVSSQNLMSKFGSKVSHWFIYKGFGLAAFIYPYIIFITGGYFFIGGDKNKLMNTCFWGGLSSVWLSVFIDFVLNKPTVYGGVVGFELNHFLYSFIGRIGVFLLLLFCMLFFLIVKKDLLPDFILQYFKKKSGTVSNEITENEIKVGESIERELTVNEKTTSQASIKENVVEEITDNSIEIEAIKKEVTLNKNLAEELVKKQGSYDPRLELSAYKFPSLDLLNRYGTGTIRIDQNELEENKIKIEDTLKSYQIDIANIKATIGPTVTLYEIVPIAGIRISKIRNLEDDIALSLAALGIRIIAPIPGRGTIGIEVPNKKVSTVSMRSSIASEKFQHSDYELPIALGKTISNETFVVDLVKMPHLLMAGATGQGKSVGLNVILTSLLYKKHPAEIKFVLVDPKKVELTLFNKIERHFLAKLPDSDEAIITDNTKVVNTLNSLCIEMDNRYEFLKLALAKNIKEYNEKFVQRKLNPNEHKYLPYLVLVIDEFADLIMTAGKEVETPIARLAQLARAVGIHLIVATQRPSVNVITGLIKANFPTRIAFRVTSKIDSRTILDAQGADQLIGRGDMLITQGNEMIRIQCAFVDTPEVNRIADFIGSQQAYAQAYLLPEYVGEESQLEAIDKAERDALFTEAAEIIVLAQQGSASLLQRKLKLGYNRAGRIVDQLELAGIIGPFEGSKARQVLVSDLNTLHDKLNNNYE